MLGTITDWKKNTKPLDKIFKFSKLNSRARKKRLRHLPLTVEKETQFGGEIMETELHKDWLELEATYEKYSESALYSLGVDFCLQIKISQEKDLGLISANLRKSKIVH